LKKRERKRGGEREKAREVEDCDRIKRIKRYEIETQRKYQEF
jgi:hypothetical protein